MPIPSNIKVMIDDIIFQLSAHKYGDFAPNQRLALYRAFGPSCVPAPNVKPAGERFESLPLHTQADLVRIHLAKLTAQKVLPLWPQACQETEAAFAATGPDTATDEGDDTMMDIQTYLTQRQSLPIEHISVYRVPRDVFAQHVMDMADVALQGTIHDFPAFVQEADECWQLYGRPERMEREFCIKWAAQDYLYELLGWTKYMYHTPYLTQIDEEYEAVSQLDAPAGYAFVAYTTEFNGVTWHVNTARVGEFWQWWLNDALPQAWQRVYS